MSSSDRRSQADRILYEFGLLKRLEAIGAAHIIGSYRMDLMAWNDLDIDIENGAMSLDRLYELSAFITKTFRPLWYEAKEERNAAGQTVWFHGFETAVTGELWNIDLWFFDQAAISDAEAFCDRIVRHTDRAQKEIIMELKRGLIERGLYSFERYKSIDVYQAVMEHGVTTIGEFLTLYQEKA